MAHAEDLSGKVFGYLKVLDRAQDHVSNCGQKKVMWNCECLLCGNKKAIVAQTLKRGGASSCGCYQAKKGLESRAVRNCVICGKEFYAPPSSTKQACSKECTSIFLSQMRKGHKLSQKTKAKISEKSKGRDMTGLRAVAAEAAKNSPKSGRFTTNVNAIDWHLISPDGKHYRFHSLNFWLRENCRELFGFDPDSREFINAKSGLNNIKRAMLGKAKGINASSYKGWQVIPTNDDLLK